MKMFARPPLQIAQMKDGMISQIVASQQALGVGLSVKCVIKDYMEDPELHKAAAVLEWRA
jgi:hypothetical protein